MLKNLIRFSTRALAILLVLTVTVSLGLVPGNTNQASAAATTYYVDGTNGSDTNNGTSLNTAFKTIQKAANVMIAGDTSYIRTGTYRETVAPVNSGSSGLPIKFKAYNNEVVTVNANDAITGWTQHSENIYKASMDWDFEKGYGNTIFVDSNLADEARWPNNLKELDTSTYQKLDSATSGGSSSNWTLMDTDLSSFSDDQINGSLLYVQVNDWNYQKTRVEDFVQSTRKLSFSPPLSYLSYTPRAGDHYYLSGLLTFLDTAGEWYKDMASNTLYIWVSGGGNPSSKVVEAKKREYTFDLDSKSYIEIDGIDIRGGQVNFSASDHCLLKDSLIVGADRYFTENTSTPTVGAGIALEGTHNTIRDSEIKDMYQAGIILRGSNNSIINNYIHHVGMYNGSGISVSGKNHLISHNTITTLGYSGIVGGPVSCVIQYNRLTDSNRIGGDGGLIYTNSDLQNTEIHHNIVGDNVGHKGAGIYPDNHSINLLVHHNVVYGISDANHTNTPANFELWYNNTFYDSADFRTFGVVNRFLYDMYGNKHFNNIYYKGLTSVPDTLMLYETKQSDNILQGNLLDVDPLFVNAETDDYDLSSNSPAIDIGLVIPGITDGYTGAAPDAGAYEYGVPKWTAGHDFANPPNPIFQLSTNVPYANKVVNGGFEQGDFTSWTTTGTPDVVSDTVWDYNNATFARNNTKGARLASGESLTQTVNGLIPNTTYVLSAWARINGVEIQAENYNEASLANNNTVTKYRGADSLGYMQNNDFLRFDNFDFGTTAKYNKISAGINNTGANGTIEVRLDSVTGTLISTIHLSAKYTSIWKFNEADLSSTTGTHHVYMVFKGTGNIALIDKFRFFNTTMTDDVNIGVKEFGAGATGDKTITYTSKDYGSNESTITFTTGSGVTSAKIYMDKPDGDWWAYIDDVGIVEQMSDFSDNFDLVGSNNDGQNYSLNNWQLPTGTLTPTLSSAQKSSGSYSVLINDDEKISKDFNSEMREKIVSFRFYDTASELTMQSVGSLYDGTTYCMLGVYTDQNPNKYVARVGSTWKDTTISRTTGWHEMKWDFSSGTDVKMYIDGILVETTSSLNYFTTMFYGDSWTNGINGTSYFDDISIKSDTLAPVNTSVKISADSVVESVYSNRREVTLMLNATDASLPLSMMVSDDAAFTGAVWEPFSTTRPFALTDGDGIKTVYAKFKDNAGNESEAVSDSIILDTIAPTLQLTVNKATIHQPNHQMVQIQVTQQTNGTDAGIASIVLASITSNEPDNGLGDGDSVNDIQDAVLGTNDTSFSLRAERSGNGNGRIYTITYTITDLAGNATNASVQVVVPH